MKTRLITMLAVTAAIAASANAGTYKNIVADGAFADWDDVPVAATSPLSPGVAIDFSSLKIANDASYVYFLITYNAPVNTYDSGGLYLGIDSDNNPSTGYGIFGSAAIGANAAFQNDFPFTQAAGNFNSGGTITRPDPGALYGAAPYNTVTLQQEIALPLSAVQVDLSSGGYSGPVFTQNFGVEFYSSDTLGPVSYSLAALPEPASIAAVVALGSVALRRRRRA